MNSNKTKGDFCSFPIFKDCCEIYASKYVQ